MQIIHKIWYIYQVLSIDGRRIEAHNFTLILYSKNLKYDTSSFNCEIAMNLSLVLKACKGLV